MSELKALTCKKCGAALNPKTLRCEYCGTYHERDLEHPYLIRVERPGVQVLGAEVAIDHYHMMQNPEMASEAAIRGIVDKLSKCLVPYIELENEYDIRTMRDIVRGRLRVVEPEFRF